MDPFISCSSLLIFFIELYGEISWEKLLVKRFISIKKHPHLVLDGLKAD